MFPPERFDSYTIPPPDWVDAQNHTIIEVQKDSKKLCLITNCISLGFILYTTYYSEGEGSALYLRLLSDLSSALLPFSAFKNQNASRPSEHPPVRGEKMQKSLGVITGCKGESSSWHLNGFPDGSTIGSTV